MFRRRLSVALSLGATLVAITACSSSTTGTAAGAPAPPAPAGNKLLDTMESAAKSASAVHIKGTIKQDGDTSSLDMQLNKDGTAAGTVQDSGTTIPVLSTGKVFYIKFTDQMETSGGIDPTSDSGKALLNKWVPSTSQMLAGEADSLKPSTDYNTFVPQLFDSMKGTDDVPKQTGSATVDGYPVFQYKVSDGTLSISQAAPHYLVRLSDAQGGSSLDFTGWNKPVAVTPPAQADIYSGPGA